MLDAAAGAGLVFFCNPNNPTGTAHRADVVEDFIRQVKRRSPETVVHVDEAYLDYAFDPAVRTVAPLAAELPGVFISRSFSKAHGMAGLRVGYAVGQPETVGAIGSAWHLGSMNTLSAAAAIASLLDTGHLAREREENARVRDFTIAGFRDMGYEVPECHANHIFVNLDRPSADFREACLKLGVRIGRDFPPMERTHSRISLGTMEEMSAAMQVFREVLRG
jgi:histidinol-phosphate aminotransferase